MNPIMENLLNLIETPLAEAQAQAREDAEEAVRAARQRLTFKEFDDLWNAITRIIGTDDVEIFTLGFRLGVQLTLEGLKPVIPK